MEVIEANLPRHVGSIVDIFVQRTPERDRTILRSELNRFSARCLNAYLVYEEDGTLAGAGFTRTASNLPDATALVLLSTRAASGQRAIGATLFAEMLEDLGEDVDRLVTYVCAEDQLSLDVARQWGFNDVQTSVTSSVDLVGSSLPAPMAGVTYEAFDDREFTDERAVDAMLLATQTNPEFDLGLVLRLAGLRETPAPDQRPLGVLTRLEGRPAAISFSVIDGDQMHVVYTGVDPELRGRGLAGRTKEVLHARARDLGVRTALTDNDESNPGIRRVNERLGYAPHSSWIWMMRPWP